MSIVTYPLSLPASPSPVSVVPSFDHAQGEVESPFTFEDQITAWGGERWMYTVTLPPMLRATAEQWIVFFLKLEGKIGTFLMGDPAAKTPRGIATGSPLVNGASQTGNTLITDGWTHSVTGILKAGDYIQLGSGLSARLYKNLTDVNSDSSGNATLTIKPAITAANTPADNSALVTSSPCGLFKLGDKKITWNVNGQKHTLSFSVKMVP